MNTKTESLYINRIILVHRSQFTQVEEFRKFLPLARHTMQIFVKTLTLVVEPGDSRTLNKRFESRPQSNIYLASVNHIVCAFYSNFSRVFCTLFSSSFSREKQVQKKKHKAPIMFDERPQKRSMKESCTLKGLAISMGIFAIVLAAVFTVVWVREAYDFEVCILGGIRSEGPFFSLSMFFLVKTCGCF